MNSTAYRNAHGVELKPGNWFLGADQYGQKEGIIDRVVQRGGIADTNGGPSVVFATRSGERPVHSILADNVFQTLGPMVIEGDGTVKQNPAPRSLVNRWGTRLRVGQLVSVTAARGGRYEARIAGFATSGDFVRAYGRQVVSESGATFGVDDVHSIIEEAPRKNPLTRVKVKSPAQRGGGEPSPRLTKRRKTTQKAPPGFYANPTPRLERADQPSQREHFNAKTGKMTTRPTKRLKERRALTHYADTPGVWANPLHVGVSNNVHADKAQLLQYYVQWRLNDATWRTVAKFAREKDAEQYARAFHALNTSRYVRVSFDDLIE